MRTTSRIIGPAAAVALLAGCVITPRSEPATDPDPEPVSSLPRDDPEPSPTKDTRELSVEWTDRDGFSYRLEVTSFDLDVAVDTKRSAPGTAEVTYKYEVRAELHNTTPGRIAPYPWPSGSIRPVWDASSIACTGEPDDVFEYGSYPVGDGQCSVEDDEGLSFTNNRVQEIAEGGSVGTRADHTLAVTLIFDEADGEEAAEALRTPDGWVLMPADTR